MVDNPPSHPPTQRRTPRVVAFLDSSAATGPVLEAAGALATVIGARVDAFHVTNAAAGTARVAAARAAVPFQEIEGELPDTLIDLADDDDVAVAVIGARGQPSGPRPAGHVALSLLAGSHKPLLVVPPNGAGGPRRFRRALVPLDGTADTATAVEDLVEFFADAGVEVVPLHVLGPDTVPRCWDQPAHEPDVWGAEFLRRLWRAPRAPLELRTGAVGPQVLAATHGLGIDLIVLAWTQHLDPGRSQALQFIVAESPVPVLIFPISPGAGGTERTASPQGERAAAVAP